MRSACAKLPFADLNAVFHRHELIQVSAAAWHGFLATRRDLSAEPIIAEWVERGRPFVIRRSLPDETAGVPLGLPLPPFAGKRRIAFQLQIDDVVSRAPPPLLNEVLHAAPAGWTATLTKLERVAAKHGVEVRVFGSLAWSFITGLEYLSRDSDLDLLLSMPGERSLRRMTAEISAIGQTAPMRLDGEWVRDDGAAVNWRELQAGASQVVVKTASAVALVDMADFIGGRACG